jgi:hypothetical protein
MDALKASFILGMDPGARTGAEERLDRCTTQKPAARPRAVRARAALLEAAAPRGRSTSGEYAWWPRAWCRTTSAFPGPTRPR